MSAPADPRAAKRDAAEWLSCALNAGVDHNLRLLALERALEAQKLVVAAAEAELDRTGPCKLCGRRVTSPCNTRSSIYENGPWDFSCEAFARGDAKPKESPAPTPPPSDQRCYCGGDHHHGHAFGCPAAEA